MNNNNTPGAPEVVSHDQASTATDGHRMSSFQFSLNPPTTATDMVSGGNLPHRSMTRAKMTFASAVAKAGNRDVPRALIVD